MSDDWENGSGCWHSKQAVKSMGHVHRNGYIAVLMKTGVYLKSPTGHTGRISIYHSIGGLLALRRHKWSLYVNRGIANHPGRMTIGMAEK